MRRNRVPEPWLSLIFGLGLIIGGLLAIPTAADRSAILVSLGISLFGLGLLLYYFVRRRIWQKSLLTFP